MVRDETREAGGAGRPWQGVQILSRDARKPLESFDREMT